MVAGAAGLAVIGTAAHAGSLKPDPARPTPIPKGYTNVSAVTPELVVNVTPSPALLRLQGNCSWLLPALSAEGFTKRDPATHRRAMAP
jgi:hypothetical protein